MKVASSMAPSVFRPLRSVLESPHLALIAAVLFWSGNFVAGRALRDDIAPITLNFLRWLVALTILMPFIVRDVRASRLVIRREWRLILAMGATGIAGFHSMTYVALQQTTAISALLTLSLVPVLILAGENMLNKKWPSSAQIAGTFVSLLGAVALITGGNFIAIGNLVFNGGDLWMIGGILIWSAYCLLLRRRPSDLPQSVALAASIAAGLVLLVPFVGISALLDPVPVVSARTVIGIGYVAVFASVIAFLCWSYGVTEVGAGRAGQFVHLMPVFGAVLAFVLLNEVPSSAQVAGAALVMTGIWLVNRSQFTESESGQRQPSVRSPVQVSSAPKTCRR